LNAQGGFSDAPSPALKRANRSTQHTASAKAAIQPKPPA